MAEQTASNQDTRVKYTSPLERQIDLLEVAIKLASHKKTILGVPFLTAVVTAIVTLFLPNIYTATTQIMPPQQQSSAASALLGQLGALGGISASSFGIKNPNETYVSMLKSRTVQDHMIKRFNLQERYRTELQSDTRKALEKNSDIALGRIDGIIAIKVDDRDPKRAADMANAYVEELQNMTQVLAVTEASQRRLFFEKQLQIAKTNLADAETALKGVQEQTGLIQLDAQAEALIMGNAELRAQIAMKEVELGAMQTFATGNNPDVIRTRQQIAGMKSQLTKLETGSVTTASAPKAGLAYIRKLRDVKYAETIFELLAKQYEMAKVDEARDGSVIQVIDRAVPPDVKSRPGRSLMVIKSAFIAGLLVIMWVFIRENNQLNPAQRDRLETLKSMLRRQ